MSPAPAVWTVCIPPINASGSVSTAFSMSSSAGTSGTASARSPGPFVVDFLLEDPRKVHSSWSPDIWKLIVKGEVAIGMTREMFKMPCTPISTNLDLR